MSAALEYLRRDCENIDASVFSSDLLYSDEQLALFKEYIGRWNRAIAEYEAAAALPPTN